MALALLLSSAAARAATVNLDTIINDIESAGTRLRQQDAALGASLDRDGAALTDLMRDKSLSAADLLVLRYYRAYAWVMRNEFTAATHRGVFDAELAAKTLPELEDVAAGIDQQTGATAQKLSVFKGNALYIAGNLAYNQLKDQSRAYRNWTACAAIDHAGCLNNMAIALTAGDGGMAMDFNESLRMHKRAFESAANYGCAGVFAAYSASVMVALGVVKNTKDNAEIWIQNASNLLNVLEADQPGDRRCSRPTIQLAHYMIALAHGKKDPTLLDEVTADRSGKFYGDLARYLKGEIDRQALEQKFAQIPDWAKCESALYGLWSADLSHNKEEARHFQSVMTAASADLVCRTDIAYTRGLKILQ